MPIEEIRAVRNLACLIDPRDFIANNLSSKEFVLYGLSGLQRTISNSFSIGSETPINQSISFYPSSYILRSFRVFINILSIEAVKPIIPDIEDTNTSIIIKNQENDSKYPFYWMYLELKQGDKRTPVGQFRLQNKRPGYYINLLPFLSEADDFLGDSNTEVTVSIQDSGWGFPGADDIISFYGEIEEVGYVAPLQQVMGTLNNVLSGSITTVSNGSVEPTPTTTEFKLNINSSVPNQLRIYYLPPTTDLQNTIDLSSAEMESFTPTAQVDLTTFLSLNGVGYYVIAPSVDTLTTQFWTSPSMDTTIAPTDRASRVFGFFTNTGLGYTDTSTLYVIHVLNLPASILVTWQ